jgi:hypothetical protein
MASIFDIYEEWRNTTRREAREEGDRASITGMLVAKFGAIDSELEAVIPQLLTLDPTERARSVMNLSREALLKLV